MRRRPPRRGAPNEAGGQPRSLAQALRTRCACAYITDWADFFPPLLSCVTLAPALFLRKNALPLTSNRPTQCRATSCTRGTRTLKPTAPLAWPGCCATLRSRPTPWSGLLAPTTSPAWARCSWRARRCCRRLRARRPLAAQRAPCAWSWTGAARTFCPCFSTRPMTRTTPCWCVRLQ